MGIIIPNMGTTKASLLDALFTTTQRRVVVPLFGKAHGNSTAVRVSYGAMSGAY